MFRVVVFLDLFSVLSARPLLLAPRLCKPFALSSHVWNLPVPVMPVARRHDIGDDCWYKIFLVSFPPLCSVMSPESGCEDWSNSDACRPELSAIVDLFVIRGGPTRHSRTCCCWQVRCSRLLACVK